MLQTVIDGKWTFDKLEELTKDVFVNINNNSSTDAADMVGYGLMKSALCDAFFYNAGGSVIEFDKDGLFSFKPVTDRTISIMGYTQQGVYRKIRGRRDDVPVRLLLHV